MNLLRKKTSDINEFCFIDFRLNLSLTNYFQNKRLCNRVIFTLGVHFVTRPVFNNTGRDQNLQARESYRFAWEFPHSDRKYDLILSHLTYKPNRWRSNDI